MSLANKSHLLLLAFENVKTAVQLEQSFRGSKCWWWYVIKGWKIGGIVTYSVNQDARELLRSFSGASFAPPPKKKKSVH